MFSHLHKFKKQVLQSWFFSYFGPKTSNFIEFLVQLSIIYFFSATVRTCQVTRTLCESRINHGIFTHSRKRFVNLRKFVLLRLVFMFFLFSRLTILESFCLCIGVYFFFWFSKNDLTCDLYKAHIFHGYITSSNDLLSAYLRFIVGKF